MRPYYPTTCSEPVKLNKDTTGAGAADAPPSTSIPDNKQTQAVGYGGNQIIVVIRNPNGAAAMGASAAAQIQQSVLDPGSWAGTPDSPVDYLFDISGMQPNSERAFQITGPMGMSWRVALANIGHDLTQVDYYVKPTTF